LLAVPFRTVNTASKLAGYTNQDLARAASRREQAQISATKNPADSVGGARVSCNENVRSPGAVRRQGPFWITQEG
jgi:hypothetical protein